jgi:hypothetical protein
MSRNTEGDDDKVAKLQGFDPAQMRVDAGDDSELRESLQQLGWIHNLPAFVDEHGKVLVGNRRMRLAKELGVAPVIIKLEFGEGPKADAERIKLALASNIAHNALTKKDRKHIAEYLYGEREWTMEAIAKVLSVGVKTVSRDLEGFVTVTKPSRPRGGRPKGSTANMATVCYEAGEDSRPPVQATVCYEKRDVIRPSVEITPIRYETTEDTVDEARMQAAEAAFESGLRDAQKQLEQEFEARVQAETQKRLDAVEAKMAGRLAAAHEQVDCLRAELREKNRMDAALRGIVRTLIRKCNCALADIVPKTRGIRHGGAGRGREGQGT